MNRHSLANFYLLCGERMRYAFSYKQAQAVFVQML
jgi:hypothetical protein